jgi:nicotinate-nucleotide adenylyltransferase
VPDSLPLALLGGTFDPPHIGHLVLAECARLQFGAEKVLFLPAGDPWRKAGRPVTPAADRLAMVSRAVASNSHFFADDRELRRAGPTYTVDTLESLRDEGYDNLILILGSDAVADMPTWKLPERIRQLATIVVARKDQATVEAGMRVVDMPPIGISSTNIRARVAAGKTIRYLVLAPVGAYIYEHGLYQRKSPVPSRRPGRLRL